jgi:probable phosphoglycerate mutase
MTSRDPTELVLVRHGEAVVNLQPMLDGVCRGLTELGRDQAARLAARITAEVRAAGRRGGPTEPDTGRGIAAVLHSPVPRCAQTARILATATATCCIAVPELRGPEHGVPGVSPWDPTTNAIGTIPPLAPERAPAPGAETWQHFITRTGAALLDIADRWAGRRVLVVAHSETASAALHTFLRLPVTAGRWAYTVLRHTALTTWTREYSGLPGADPAGSWCLVAHNDDRHLDDDIHPHLATPEPP